MKTLLFAAGQHDTEMNMRHSFFIHVDQGRDDSSPFALFCGVRSMSIQLHPARLASELDLSHELSRLAAFMIFMAIVILFINTVTIPVLAFPLWMLAGRVWDMQPIMQELPEAA
ncbi:MAG: hypothetical protein GX803_09200 [Lentisphaerae bacterium]|nr:hypothetical protein [Lentisphaerota bacterium]